MAMTDPVADLLTRIRNGAHARKEQVDIPWSRVKARIAEILVAEGFLKEATVIGDGPRRTLRVWLRYDAGNRPVITGIRRVSRPSLRVYRGAREIPPVRGGFGISVVSTPAGIVTDREARRLGVGGEIICSVW